MRWKFKHIEVPKKKEELRKLFICMLNLVQDMLRCIYFIFVWCLHSVPVQADTWFSYPTLIWKYVTWWKGIWFFIFIWHILKYQKCGIITLEQKLKILSVSWSSGLWQLPWSSECCYPTTSLQDFITQKTIIWFCTKY